MLLLADNCDVVFSCPRIKFKKFLSGKELVVWLSPLLVSHVHEADADHAQADNNNSCACAHRHLGRGLGISIKTAADRGSKSQE